MRIRPPPKLPPKPPRPPRTRKKTKRKNSSSGAPLEERLDRALAAFPAGSRFVLAVSGGADSTALLAAMTALSPGRGFVLSLLHVDHGIRPAGESRADAEAVRALAARFGLPLRVCRFPQGMIARKARGTGIEAAARRFRYRAFRRELRRTGALRVLTGHNRDDALENILMAFLRGAGPAALSGMRRDTGLVFRPLLDTGRAEIRAWLAARALPWREDSTNADTSLFRNRVRRTLTPVLDREFPFWRRGLESLARIQRQTADFVGEEAARRIPWTRIPRLSGANNNNEGNFSLECGAGGFFAAPALLREAALFRGANLLGRPGRGTVDADPPPARRTKRGGRLRRETLRAALRALAAGSAAADLGDLRAEIRDNGNRLVLERARSGTEGFFLLIEKPGTWRTGNLEAEVVRSGEEPEKFPLPPASFSARLPLVFRSLFPGEVPPLPPGAGKDGAAAGFFDSLGCVAVYRLASPGGAAPPEPLFTRGSLAENADIVHIWLVSGRSPL